MVLNSCQRFYRTWLITSLKTVILLYQIALNQKDQNKKQYFLPADGCRLFFCFSFSDCLENHKLCRNKSAAMKGFRILLVKFAEESRCPHHLFFKPHSVKASVAEPNVVQPSFAEPELVPVYIRPAPAPPPRGCAFLNFFSLKNTSSLKF